MVAARALTGANSVAEMALSLTVLKIYRDGLQQCPSALHLAEYFVSDFLTKSHCRLVISVPAQLMSLASHTMGFILRFVVPVCSSACPVPLRGLANKDGQHRLDASAIGAICHHVWQQWSSQMVHKIACAMMLVFRDV